MPFMTWWESLNVALAVRDEPEALYGEARGWYDMLVVKELPERLVNRIINSRKPL